MREISQQTILVTGATDGMGRELAAQLSEHGARVLVHGRSQKRLDDAVRFVAERSGRAAVEPYLADFASLAQVREMADRVRHEHGSIDVLVNNAGLGAGKHGDTDRQLTEDGYELRFQASYLAPFALTAQLVDTLAANGGARVVNVASVGQQPVDFDDLQMEQGYTGLRAYGQSKLALIMHAFELAERGADLGIRANALHPASLMNTKMVEETFGYTLSTIEDGAANTLRLAVDPQLDQTTGKYFNEDHEDRANDQAYDPQARRRLWELASS